MSMQRAVLSIGFSAVVIMGITASSARDKEADKDFTKAIAEAAVKLSGSSIKAIGKTSDIEFPKPEGSATEQHEALAAALIGYKRERALQEGMLDQDRATAEFLMDSSAAIAVYSGVGAVPALIVRGAVQVGTDMYFDNAAKQMNKELEGYLASKKPELIKIGGVKYEQLRAKSPAEIGKALNNSTKIFNELEGMFPDDPAGKQMAKDLVIEGIRNTSLATLDLVAKDSKRIDKVQGRLEKLTRSYAKFTVETTKTLKAHEEALASLGGAVNELKTSVVNLDTRMKAQERDQGIIADFVFDRMPAEMKVQSLEAGFLGERFSCADATVECEAAKLKTDLLARFKAEAKVDKFKAGFQTTVAGLANAATIASNLGIDVPGLDDAAKVGSVAFDAFSNFAAGNYLGAAAAVTGLFATRADPEQARFDALRGYLDRQFARINAQLEVIISNQQKLMDAIVQLSEQMQRQYDALEERLAKIEFELKRVSDTARMTAWSAWAPCHAVYLRVATEASLFDFSAGDFQSMNGIYALAQAEGNSIRSCRDQTRNAGSSMAAQQIFGSFFDVRNAVDYYKPDLIPAESASGKYHPKSALEAFLTGVHTPTVDILSEFLERRKVPWSYALQLMALPAPTVKETDDRVVKIPDKKEPCGSNGYVLERLQRSVCFSADGPENAANRILSTAMLADTALIISDWILVNARGADILDQTNNQFIPPSEVLKSSGRLSGAGAQMTRDALTIVDAAMTTYSVLYGDVTARAVVDILNEGPGKNDAEENLRVQRIERARSLLASNGYLAANVATLLLHDRWNVLDQDGKKSPPSRHAYRAALDYALSSKVNPTWLLEGLFSGSMEFVAEHDTQRVLVTLVGTGDKRVQVPLRGVEAFIEGQLVFPPRMISLLRRRAQLVDRVIDYTIFTKLPLNQRETLALLIGRSARNLGK